MTPVDKTAKSQGESISFEFDLDHAPEKVWRALTDPVEAGIRRRALWLEDDGRKARRPARRILTNGGMTYGFKTEAEWHVARE